MKWLIAAGLVAATTAGCTQTTGYPAYVTSGYDSGSYYSSPSYYSGYSSPSYYSGYSSPSYYGYSRPAYYGSSYYTPSYTRPVVVNRTVNRTVVNRVVQAPQQVRTPRDNDGDGVPNRRDRFDNNPRRN